VYLLKIFSKEKKNVNQERKSNEKEKAIPELIRRERYILEIRNKRMRNPRNRTKKIVSMTRHSYPLWNCACR